MHAAEFSSASTPSSWRSGFAQASSGRHIHGDYLDFQSIVRRGLSSTVWSGTYDDGTTAIGVFVRKYERWTTDEAPAIQEAMAYAEANGLAVNWLQMRPNWIAFRGSEVLLVDWDRRTENDFENRLWGSLRDSRASDAFSPFIRDLVRSFKQESDAGTIRSLGTWVTAQGPRDSRLSLVSDGDSDLASISLTFDERVRSPLDIREAALLSDRDDLIRALDAAGRLVGINVARR
ncbi:hypothetical protein FRC05_006473 [Tulasnella sp. 425]|nr:hypothetical protein FRC05_006473 [Tulasnella sp. 425]